MEHQVLAVSVAFTIAVAAAGLSDLLRFRIPNWMVIGIVALFGLAALFSEPTLAGLASHVASGAVVLAAGFACYAARLCGAGDAKLAGAIALWLGFPAVLDFVAITAIAGGVLAAAIAVLCRLPVPAATRPAGALMSHYRSRGDVPYGVAMAIAAAIA